MAITITDNAAKHIHQQINNHDGAIGLRLSVKTNGCTGLGYVVEFATRIQDNDRVFEDQKIQVIIAELDLIYLNGIELDYTTDGINEGFQFNNPNAKDSCGCGESFNI